jgi:hypothetical protein
LSIEVTISILMKALNWLGICGIVNRNMISKIESETEHELGYLLRETFQMYSIDFLSFRNKVCICNLCQIGNASKIKMNLGSIRGFCVRSPSSLSFHSFHRNCCIPIISFPIRQAHPPRIGRMVIALLEVQSLMTTKRV